MLSQAVMGPQEDWLSYMLGQDVYSDGFYVDLPAYTAANDDYVMTDAEAEFEDFLSFIVDFQSKNKA